MTTDTHSRSVLLELQPAARVGPTLEPARPGYELDVEGVTVVPDPFLGVALLLEPGDDVAVSFPELHRPTGAFAVSAWARWGPAMMSVDDDALGTTELPGGWCSIQFGGEDVLAQLGPSSFAVRSIVAAEDQWHHVVLLWLPDGAGVQVYLDGEWRGESEAFPTEDDFGEVLQTSLSIAVDPYEARSLFLGPLRLYRDIPSLHSLRDIAYADRLAHPSLDDRHPISVRLADDVDEPHLYITDDDVGGRSLHVVLENRSRFPVSLPRATRAELAQEPSWSRALELRFRPGCLEPTAGHWVEPDVVGWAVGAKPNSDGGVSIYLARSESTTLEPGQSMALTLNHVRCSAAVGAHGTRVELRYAHPHHPERNLLCSRICVARVVGQRGRRRSPLRVGVEQGRHVVSDGETVNEVVLYVANTSKNATVRLPSSVHGVGAALTVTFDAGDVASDWALGTVDQLLGADFSCFKKVVDDVERDLASEGPHWAVDVDTQGENPVWTLSPTRDERLEPGERLRIRIGTLVTNLPSGVTRGYVRLENIPGYWDDERTVELRKLELPITVSPHGVLVAGNVSVAGTLTDHDGEVLPPGTIVLWSASYGGDVPNGWAPCDGKNGTPNLWRLRYSARFEDGKVKPWVFPIIRVGDNTLDEPPEYVSQSA